MGKKSVKPATAFIPPDAGLPTPEAVCDFLRKNYQLNCLDPTKPLPFWEELKLPWLPFSNQLVGGLREPYRDQLRKIDDDLRDSRTVPLKGDVNPMVDCPTSADLFQIAGAHVDPQQRVRTCMRMAGITQGDIERELNVSKFNDWLNGHTPTPRAMPRICQYLGVHKDWVERGPKAYTPTLEDGVDPWWLRPWRVACRDAQDVFKVAERTVLKLPLGSLMQASEVERDSLLRWRKDATPPSYDFAAFWSTWQKNPEAINLGMPEVLERALKECLHNPKQIPPEDRRSAGPKKAIIPDGDPLPSYLPWMFECRMCFNAGNPTFQVTFTPETWATLQWILSYYTKHGVPARHASSLPPGKRPTAADVLALQTWLTMPPAANSGLVDQSGHGGLPTPKYVPAPAVLPSDRSRPRRGAKGGPT